MFLIVYFIVKYMQFVVIIFYNTNLKQFFIIQILNDNFCPHDVFTRQRLRHRGYRSRVICC